MSYMGLTSQMRRCSASIAANIAEGCGRTGNGDLHRFLSTARGSAAELEYFILLFERSWTDRRGGHGALNSQTQEVREDVGVADTKGRSSGARGPDAEAQTN